MMRFILFSMAVGLCAAPLRAELPELLNEACMKVSRDTERWAYTETTITTDQKGRSEGATVVHVDPSKPYAEQFIPIKIDGKAPTERQLKQYRSKGERHERSWNDGSARAGRNTPANRRASARNCTRSQT